MFIKKNAERWKEYQEQPTTDPDAQADRFITLLDDLAYSKTFYPQSKVTRWINAIAATIYQSIYQNKKEKYSRLGRFWKIDLPLTMYRNRKVLLFTFSLFILFIIIAVWSSIQNPKFVNGFMGDGYVSMTEENIEKGDPFGVYRDKDKFTMFATIMYNNVFVSFISYVGGIAFGLGTFWRIMNDGLLIGTFEYLFFSKGLGIKSILVIWIHGTIEMSCMVLASTAGFIIAKGIMFPGTYSRKDSFTLHLKDSLKVILALVPLLVIAAFFESYVTYLMSNSFDKTANESLPPWMSVLILAASGTFMVWYFVIYPAQVNARIKKETAPSPSYLMTV